MRAWSPWMLIVANLFPVIGVFLWNWDAAAIVIFYWSENLIIGALTLLKMLIKSPVLGWFSGAFFLVHYGGFCAVHGMLATAFMGVDIGDPFDGVGLPFVLIFVELLIGVIRGVLSVAPPDWMWGFGAIALSHTFSMITNYFGRGEHKEQRVRGLMAAPYRRVIVLHIAILLGGASTVALGSPLPLLILLIAGKIVLDLHLHLKEHGLSWRSLTGSADSVSAPGV